MPTRTNPQTVRAALITGGALHLLDTAPTRDAIAALVDAVGPMDADPRHTWICRDGTVLTVWAAHSAPQSHRNDLAARVVDELVPPLAPGVRDRIRESLAATPLAGPCLITGYRPADDTGPGQLVSLPDAAVDRVRSAADGRRARREAAELDTAPLPVPPPTTVVPEIEVTEVGGVPSSPATGGVAALTAKLAAGERTPARARPWRRTAARR